jgi:3-oxoacyl-[acyl-carrier-protein] synthase-1
LAGREIPRDRSVLILSTTKGNIGFLEAGQPGHPRVALHSAATFLADRLGFKHHFMVSNACVSGVMSLIVAKRMLETARYDHALVAGGDVLTRFVTSGFQSLLALSPELCRPFDADRKGINLGEAAASILLTTRPGDFAGTPAIRILGGGLSNDANHISGPSRTGEELGYAIQDALEESGIGKDGIDFISAHGTATRYNDEMEANAFARLGLEGIPTNSLKAYFGHTLGAAGLVETAMSCESLLQGELIATLGFETLGVSQPINIIRETVPKVMNTCLKTASGFGGCNAAIILRREN